eukprot:TRINITY_DN670_c1_g1_i4.p1 TRINITY_DN670_c1_g1~~TRINITY_DN670_c1_g1_i4.p1  ORF type:complete len:724 (+),score=135.22 TRINITY_DN670_c1_g1_i4:81-2252(+)
MKNMGYQQQPTPVTTKQKDITLSTVEEPKLDRAHDDITVPEDLACKQPRSTFSSMNGGIQDNRKTQDTNKMDDEEPTTAKYPPYPLDFSGVPPPTVDGEFTQLSEGEPFFRIDKKSPESDAQQIFFWNGSPSKSFRATYVFRGPGTNLTCLKDGVFEEGEHKVSVHPGETAAFVEGTTNGWSVSFLFGPPPEEYSKLQVAKTDKRISAEVSRLRKLVQNNASAAEVADVCIEHGLQFVDFTEFPPGRKSLQGGLKSMKERAWMRPQQFLHGLKPELFVEDSTIAPNNIGQGELGDCWLLGAVAAVAEFPENILRIFNRAYRNSGGKLSRTTDARHGIYRLRLNKNGWWTTVIVDTFLPVSGLVPCFAKNVGQPTELWCSLLEKAFAKLHGSYGSIRGGPPECALQDLTGWPSERMEWDDKGLFAKLLSYDQQQFLMTLATSGEDNTNYDGGGKTKGTNMNAEYEKVGLVCGHAYSLIQVIESEGFQLCQIRNPWGEATQWNGDWSDTSPLWRKHPKTRSECQFRETNDGTFWMPWNDIRKYFTEGAVCYAKPRYKDIRVRGQFKCGIPSLIIKITVEQKTRLFATLSQIDQRGTSSNTKNEYEPLLLSLAYPSKDGYENERSLDSHGGSFYGSRDVQFRTSLSPCSRSYYLVPRCYYKEHTVPFVISLLTQQPVTVSFVEPTKDLMKAFRYSPFVFQPSGLRSVRAKVQVNGADSTILSTVSH